MPEQKILLGSTQTLVSYPRVSDGGEMLRAVPTAVVVRIQTPAVAMPADTAWVAATVDPLATSLTDAVAEGDTTASLTGTPDLVRGRLLLITALANVAPVVVEVGVTRVSASSLIMRQPAISALSASSTVAGFACTKALTAAQTATAGEGVAIWKATIGGVDYTWAQAFRIVRRMPQSVVTPASLSRDCPDILKKRSRNDVDLEELIQAAWVHEVLPVLDAHDIAEEDIVSVDALEPLHVQACLLRTLRNREDTSGEYFARVKERFEQLRETTFARSTWYEVSQQEDPPHARTPGADANTRSTMRMGR